MSGSSGPGSTGGAVMVTGMSTTSVAVGFRRALRRLDALPQRGTFGVVRPPPSGCHRFARHAVIQRAER
jgi:hypothetical protein